MGRMPWNEVHQERIGDCVVTVRSTGRGEPVVLVHGIGVSSRYFQRLAAELASSNTVYAIELPGFGASPESRRTLSVPELGGLVISVLRRLDLSGVVLVGHSMGCQVATETAAGAPELVHKLVLLGPTVNDQERSIRMQALRLVQDTLRESPAVNWMVFTDYLRAIVPYIRTLPAMVGHKLEEALPRVSCPVVLIRGARDPIVPADWLLRLAAANPNSVIVEVPGVPHVLMHSKPAETAHGLLTGHPHAAA